MKNIFFIFFIACLSTSFAQNFSSYSDVLVYTNGKVFQNSQGNVKISINENGIQVNGNNEYFNIEISVISSTVAIIKGQSLRNADGTISMRLNSSTGCLYQDGESYCARANSINTSSQVNTISEKTNIFIQMLPATFEDTQALPMSLKRVDSRLSLNKNGTGKWWTMRSGDKSISWTIKNEKNVVVTDGSWSLTLEIIIEQNNTVSLQYTDDIRTHKLYTPK
jgi:hypothetical protein